MVCVGRSKETKRPVCPLSRILRYSAFYVAAELCLA
jgi:hypothetical protein